MKRVTASFFILILVLVLTGFLISLYPPINSSVSTGSSLFGAVLATVGFFVEGGLDLIVTIDSPQNITYNFSIGDPNYTLFLNVSSSEETSTWWYSLYNARHNEYVNQSVIFTPNTTFDAVRWNNRLEVYTNNTAGSRIGNTNVSFFVYVPNSAPIIHGLPSELLACEAGSLTQGFNVSDVDEDSLIFGVSPSNPFFVIPILTGGRRVESKAELFSATLSKSHVNSNLGYKLHELVVFANDGQYIDTKGVNVTVIEINNAPNIQDIGVQTVWTSGQDSIFDYQVLVSDIEDGNSLSGNLSFNISFLSGTPFFGINETGYMWAAPNSSQVGIYELSVCVTDSGISPVHQNISFCGQDGSNRTSCDTFSLTVTNENRAPEISEYNPSILYIEADSTETLKFNITKTDPDGTIPDAYWYVNDVLIEIDSGSSVDVFSYNFGCEVSDNQTIMVEITDGLLNDSVEWDVNLTSIACPVSGGGGGGGGGGPRLICLEKWGCTEWDVCQHAGLSFQSGILSVEDFSDVRSWCAGLGYDEDYCGYQIRECTDTAQCGTHSNKSSTLQACYFVHSPSCTDGIKNCHGGSCELLIDCGGPCSACPTCSDGIRNQGEQGIDCGGPCPNRCPVEIPQKAFPFQYVLIILAALLFIFALYKIMKLRELKRRKK